VLSVAGRSAAAAAPATNWTSAVQTWVTMETTPFDGSPSGRSPARPYTVDRPGDDPRKECEECGNARVSNVRYYPT
jgi:hypothetical protein